MYSYQVGQQYVTVTGDVVTVAHVLPGGSADLLDSYGRSIQDLARIDGTRGGAPFIARLHVPSAASAFKVGDRVCARGAAREGTITNAVALVGRLRVEWDDGYSGTYPEADLALIQGLSRDQVGTKCQCGALKAKTTHATWCGAHASGGTPAFKMPERLSF